jgi:hypothetical protein
MSENNGKTYALAGEIVCWKTGCAVPYAQVKAALAASGLPDVAKDMLPRNAFSRGARKLCKERIFTKIKEDKDTVWYQFNAKMVQDDHIDLPLEATIQLEKDSGKLTSTNATILAEAEAEMLKAIGERTSGDITRIVQKLFEDRAGLWAIRDQGGAYFVPIAHQAFTAQVEMFLAVMGGNMRRFPVPEGTAQGNAAIKDTLASGLASIIAEHEQAIADFTDENRPSTLERCAEKLQKTKFQIEAYATYLDDQKDQLLGKLQQSMDALKAKIEAREEGEPEEAVASGGGMMPLFSMIA